MTPKYSCFPKTTHIIFQSSQEPADRPDLHSMGRAEQGKEDAARVLSAVCNTAGPDAGAAMGTAERASSAVGLLLQSYKVFEVLSGCPELKLPYKQLPLKLALALEHLVSPEHQPQTPLAVTARSMSPSACFCSVYFQECFSP